MERKPKRNQKRRRVSAAASPRKRYAGKVPPEKRFTPKMQGSLLFVFCAVVVIFFILVGRIAYLNSVDGERYEKKVLSQQSYTSNAIPYKRGDIIDRNGTKLAVSEKVYNVILDPKAMLEKETYKEPTIAALSSCFGMSSEEVEEVLRDKKDARYVPMKDYKEIEYEVIEKFKKEAKKNKKIQGVWFEEEYVRRYPLNNVASILIGFTQKGDANIGTWGIEENYNEELSGTNGREYGYFNSDLELERTVKPAVNGNNIITTIDSNVQSIVEGKVEKYLDETGAKNMAVLLMNPQNGEIYSMVSNRSFDLNNPRDLSAFFTEKELESMSDAKKGEELSKLWRNFCISDAFEPGSTFKPFTIAAALDEHKVTTKTTFTCNRSKKVADRNIACTGAHGTITIREALMKSCNVALMDIGEKMGRNLFSEYLSFYGFGVKTGIDLPGEGTGIIKPLEALNPVELATSSFGQTNTVTMIQMAAGFSSLINGGSYYIPHVVKEIQNENGAVVRTVDSQMVKKTVSKETSDLIRGYLYETVEEGTASPAGVEGYSIGGKTGTAEKYPRKQGNYVVSFLGFTPAENPQLVAYVVIDEPGEEEQDHSTYATEFAHDVLKDVLPFLGIYKETEKGKAAEEPKEEDTKEDSVRNGGNSPAGE